MNLSALRQRGRHRRYEADFRLALGLFSQDDLAVANAAGATVRADINSNLQALGSNMSGASAPGTTYAYQWWADTTNGVLKERNAANSGWLVRGSLTEAFVVSRSSNTILAVADFGKAIIATSAFTQTLTAAATLGDGWYVDFINNQASDCTIDPNGSENINGATTLAVPGYSCGRIYCNGSSFQMSLAPLLLDGTFSPTVTLVGGAGNTVPVYTTNTGRYTRYGRRVFCDIFLNGDGGAEGAGTGQITIALPFAINAASVGGGAIIGQGVNNTASYQLFGGFTAGASVVSVNYWSSISAVAALTGADQNNTTRSIRMSFSYEM